MTTFTNSFHGTEARIRANLNELVNWRTAQRIERALCGIAGCSCYPYRGSQYRLTPADDRRTVYRVEYNC